LIVLSAFVAGIDWSVSGAGTTAWMGGTAVFAVLMFLWARSSGQNEGECGCLLLIFTVLVVVGYLAWLKWASEEKT
jgi:hypothetical protein